MKKIKVSFTLLFLTASLSTCTQFLIPVQAVEEFAQKTVNLSNASTKSEDSLRKQNTTYERYYNDRFNYSIAYPVGILIPQGEAQNGDGQKFISKDKNIVMAVYGSRNVFNKKLEEVYRTESRNGTPEHPTRVVTYKTRGDSWFVVSGYEDGKVFYNKTILRNGDFKVLDIRYNKSLKSKFDPIVAEIAKSFRG